MDFHGVPYLALPPGMQWGYIGMFCFYGILFICFLKSMLFYFFCGVNAFIFLFFVDVGPVHLVGLSRHVRVVRKDEPVALELDASLRGVESNLTRLSSHVSMTNVEDLPIRMQRHVTGIPQSWDWLLKRVATSI